LEFGEPSFIDRNRAGGEPVSIVAQDGSINVSAHAGTTHMFKDPMGAPGIGDFANGYFNQTLNWRSTDGGTTWKYIGLNGMEMGPHSATSTGFSDPDFAMDRGGRIYNTEIDLANVAVFSSNDDGQTYTLAEPFVSAGDRPWVTGGNEDEVFLYVNLPKQLWRSTDAGITWSLVSVDFPADGKLFNDPLNFESGLIGPAGPKAIAITQDDGKTWRTYAAPLGPDSDDSIKLPAIDRAGNVYLASAGGYSGPNDDTPDGEVTFNYFDRELEEWADEPITIPTPPGDKLWAWQIAGDDGRAAVVWYQTLAPADGETADEASRKWYAFAAYTTNGTGTTVTCSDGTTEFVPPQFSVVNASGRPVHLGKICTSGTTCNAATTPEGGDRRLGDFYTVNFDHMGNLFLVSADTTLRNAQGGPKPVGNPIFIRQTSGDQMLVAPDADLTDLEPDEPRETREPCGLDPTC
jgi:hypothetical protein